MFGMADASGLTYFLGAAMIRPLNAPSLGLLVVLSGATLLSQTPTPGKADLVHCASAELNRHPFRVGELELKIKEFKPNRGIGTRLIAFQVENHSQEFLAFAAQDLVLVSSDGNQITEAAPSDQFRTHPLPQRVRIAPGARLALTFYPEQTVKYPAKLYLGDKLLAEITE